METTSKILRLTFSTDTPGKEIEIDITKPKEGIDALDIKPAMEDIVGTGQLVAKDTTEIVATGIKKAEYLIRQVESINLG